MDLKQLSLFYSYDLYFTIFQLISTRPRVVEQFRVALCFSANKKKFQKNWSRENLLQNFELNKLERDSQKLTQHT